MSSITQHKEPFLSFPFIVILLMACLLSWMYNKDTEIEVYDSFEVSGIVQYLDSIRFVNVTTYQAEKKQTDNRPLETASGIVVTKDMYHTGQSIGYCAVSRDLLNHYFNFMDTIFVPIKGELIPFIIIDTMNSRCINSVDILTDSTFKLKTSIYIKK